MKKKTLFLLLGLVLIVLLIRSVAVRAFIAALSPFFAGFLFAYFLDPVVRFFEQLLHHRRGARTLAVCITIFLTLAAVAGLCCIILPSLLKNLTAVLTRLPQYYNAVSTFFTKLQARGFFDLSAVAAELSRRVTVLSGDLAEKSVGFLSNAVGAASDLSVAVVSGIYLLLFKERFIAGIKKLLFALFPAHPTERAIDLMRDSNKVFIGYLYSKLLTSLIVGVATLALMLLCALPNAPLISAIMTLFNTIPFFGPILGAIPGVLLLLLENPYHALLFILITLLVQFLDNQFFTPKIVGDRVGINPFWVLFSIILGGHCGGITGMFFGVPVFAVLYGILKRIANARLAKKGLSTHTMDYAVKK